MKISCDIIRDVLPLYAEDMVSGATREMVELHLCECPDCTDVLQEMQEQGSALAAFSKPSQEELDAFLRLRRGIVLRRVLTVLSAVLLVLSVFISWDIYMNGSVYLTAEQAIESVEPMDNGGVRVNFIARGGYGLDVYQEENYYVMLVSVRRRNYLSHNLTSNGYYNGVRTRENIPLSQIDIWYADPSTGCVETLLWDGEASDSEMTLDRSVPFRSTTNFLELLFLACVALTGLLGGIAALTKEYRFGFVPLALSAACGSLALSNLIFTGGSFLEIGGLIWTEFVRMCMVALLFWVTFLCFWRLIQLSRKDRGI